MVPGVTLWEIFTFGQRPYAAIETADVKRFVLTGGRLSQPDICTLEAYQRLLLACTFTRFRLVATPVYRESIA